LSRGKPYPEEGEDSETKRENFRKLNIRLKLNEKK